MCIYLLLEPTPLSFSLFSEKFHGETEIIYLEQWFPNSFQRGPISDKNFDADQSSPQTC